MECGVATEKSQQQAMKTQKLTKTAVEEMVPSNKAFTVYDADLKGFSIRVAPSGVKTWQVEYRPWPGGRSVAKRRMSLGAANKLPAEEARKEAKAIFAAVAKREDPARDRAEKRREHSVTSLIDLYEKEGGRILRGVRIGQPMKARNKAYMLARLRHHVVPLLGTKKVSEVRSADIERMVRDIGTGKTAKDEKIGPRKRIIVRGGDGAARKVARDLSALYTFAIRHPSVSVTENPCAEAAINKVDGKRTRFLDLEEVRRLGKALEELEIEGVNPKALNIVRLWALTGCRRDEIAALRWSEARIDLGCLVLDDTKTGESVRPLAASAVALLTSLPRYADTNQPNGLSAWVFPASHGLGHFQGTKRIWPKITKKAGLLDATPHTLRHTLGSAAVSGGMGLPMVAAILGHADTRSTQIYAHVQQHPAARAATRAVGGIAAALAGKEPGKLSRVKKKSA